MEKFDQCLKEQFVQYTELLDDLMALTEDYARKLSQTVANKPLACTLIQFARLAADTPRSVLALLRRGDIAPSYVLLRWHLEMCHLCFYLWKNPNQYELWSGGKKIQPKDVREDFKILGFPSWKEPYEEWSNVVHGNQPFIDSCHVLWTRSKTSTGLEMLVGNALMNLFWLTGKFNYVFGMYLIAEVGKEMDPLTVRCNSLQCRVLDLTKDQQDFEKRFMTKDSSK